MNELAARFHKLFAGTEHAHGTCDMLPVKMGEHKHKISARTVKEDVTDELWSEHLDGRRNIGIIPLQQSLLCGWGAIDLDGKVDGPSMAGQIDRLGFPLIVCRSKSGGAHLYSFVNPSPAGEVQNELKYFAKRLGMPRAEVFPKQTNVMFDRGDVGSWILMPYFNAPYTDRHAVDKVGKILTATEFLDLAESMVEES